MNRFDAYDVNAKWQSTEYAESLARIGGATITHKEAFVQALAMQLVLAGKGPDTAARLARATWAELYPEPVPARDERKPLCDRDTMPLSMQGCRLTGPSPDHITGCPVPDPHDLYHAAKAGK